MSALSIVIAAIFVVLAFMFLRYLLTDYNTLQNLQDGKTASTIDASSLATNGSGVPSSNYAYSIWFYVSDWNYRLGEPKIIFGRMGGKSGEDNGSLHDLGIGGKNPCPLIALTPNQNNLSISVSTYADDNVDSDNIITTNVLVPDVPIQKWVNLVVSINGRACDVYINGKLVRTSLLPGIAYVNQNSNIHVSPLGGFDGHIAKFQYFPSSLNPQDAWNIYNKGFSSWLSLFSTYSLHVSLMQNGVESTSVTV